MKTKVLLFLIITTQIILLIYLKFTAWPEMLLWPYLWLHNILPYKDVAIAHTPLLIAKLAILYKLFGVGILQLKVFTWALIIFSDILLFWVVKQSLASQSPGKKLWNSKTAVIAVSVFAFWQLFFDGNGLWFDLMLVPLSVLTFYFVSTKRYLWAGVFWAIMFFTKQTAVWFLVPIGFMLISDILRRPLKVRPCKVITNLILGISLIFVTVLLLLSTVNLLPSFYNWAIYFGLFILPRAQGQIQLPDLKNLIVAGLPFAIFIPFFLNKRTRSFNLLLWAVAGIMGAYPRFEYFHFQPGIPFLAIVSGTIFAESKNKRAKIFISFYILSSLYLFANFFIRNWGEGTRFYEQDVVDVSNYVKNNTKPGDKIFVMNWWDNIYPLTNTLPATDPWVPQLSWYQELPGIQEKELLDLKNSKPKLIIFQDYSETGLSSYKPQKVLDFIKSHYDLKEKVDGIEILIQK